MIDKEDLLKQLGTSTRFNADIPPYVIGIIKGMPDKEVRCVSCKHRFLEGSVWHCPFGLSSGEDFFCGYGERL